MIEESILKELQAIVGKKQVLTEPEDLVAYSYDGTFAERRPDAIVRPDSTEQVSEVIKVAYREEIPVIPRGMASGLAAASIALIGGMVLDTCRLNRILEIDEVNFIATAQAGVITQTLADTVAKKGLFYPPDPSSIKQSTLGGNAACNAGGPRCLKYGVTGDYVMGMTVVLADGRILETGGKAIKNVTGYNLTQLFVGSEGTLGVITELILKLVPLPKVARTAKAIFPKLTDASMSVNNILSAGITPATIELMDETTIATIEEAMHLGLPLDVEAMLIIEADGMDEESVLKEIEAIAEICQGHRGPRCGGSTHRSRTGRALVSAALHQPIAGPQSSQQAWRGHLCAAQRDPRCGGGYQRDLAKARHSHRYLWPRGRWEPAPQHPV